MTGLQLTDFELAVLIGIALVAGVALVIVARRAQPAPERVATTSSAVPADLGAIETEMTAVKGRLSELEHNVAQVRTMLNALPTKDSVHNIALQVTEVKGDLKVNNTQTTATAKAVERIEEWIMRLDKKAITE